MPVEKELKLLAEGAWSEEALLEALGQVAAVSPRKYTLVRDTYLDTRSRSLARAGLSGRWRRRGRSASLQVKPVLLAPGAVLERAELQGALAPGEHPGRALRRLVEAELPVKLRGVPVAEVELVCRRSVYEVSTAAGCRAQLSIDHATALLPGGRRGPGFVEVELELVERGAQEEDFEVLAAAAQGVAGLGPSGMSKYQRALALLELPRFEPAVPLPGFSPLAAADLVARSVCRALWESVRSYEPGTRVGLDPEYLHKMRVSTRRLRAALRAFEPCFTRRVQDYLQRNLCWLAAALGEVRDLDVQLEQLPARRRLLGADPAAGWEELRQVLDARRVAARRRLLAALDSPRYRLLCQRAPETFHRTLPRRSPSHPGRRPAVLLAEQTFGRRCGQLLKAARRCSRDPSAERVHRVRITGKKVRYVGELFAALYSKGFRTQLKNLAAFQDVLGLFNDDMVNGAMARALRDEALACGGSPAYLNVLGKLEVAALLNATAAEREVSGAFARLGGKEAVRAMVQEVSQRTEALRARLEVDLELAALPPLEPRRGPGAAAEPLAPAEIQERERRGASPGYS